MCFDIVSESFAFKPNDLLILVSMHSFFWNTRIKVENSYSVRSILVSLADIKLPVAPNVNIKLVTKFHVTSLMDLHSCTISVKDLCMWKWASFKKNSLFEMHNFEAHGLSYKHEVRYTLKQIMIMSLALVMRFMLIIHLSG